MTMSRQLFIQVFYVIIAMGNVLSDGLNISIVERRLSVANFREGISVIALVDLLIIVPSIVVFLAFNFRALSSIGLPFLFMVLVFLLYLPLVILSASIFFYKGRAESKGETKNGNVFPIVLYLMLIFSVLGIYIPSIERLTTVVPSFGSLNIIGFAIVVTNVVFVVKNVSGILKE